jgi:hypothetical protein
MQSINTNNQLNINHLKTKNYVTIIKVIAPQVSGTYIEDFKVGVKSEEFDGF